MITVTDLHMKQTVKLAVKFVSVGGDITELRNSFNSLCEEMGADELDTDGLEFDIHELVENIQKEPWVKNIASLSAEKRTWTYIENVVENFICKYWQMNKEEVTTKMVADVLKVADPLSRRHIVAQRVVIESISELQTKEQLGKLDRIMDWLAMNPKLLKY